MYQTREQLQDHIAELEKTARKTLVDHTCTLFQEMRESKRLREENARLRQAIEAAPHDLTCHSVTERHIPGLTHYETDIEDERCPRYHFKCGPCDCWKAALARTPEAKP